MSSKGKINKKTLIIVLIIVVVLIISTISIYSAFIKDKRTDEEKLLDSIIHTIFLDSAEVKAKLSIDDLNIEGMDGIENKMIIMALEDIALDIISKRDSVNEAIQLDFDLNMREISIVNGSIYFSSELVGIDIPILYDAPIYLYYDDLQKFLLNSVSLNISEIDLQEIKQRSLTSDFDDYHLFSGMLYYNITIEMLSTILEEEIVEEIRVIEEAKVKGNTYSLSYDINDMTDYIEAMYIGFQEDEKMKQTINAIGYNLDDFSESIDFDKLNNFDLDSTSTYFVDGNDVIRESKSDIELGLEEGLGYILPHKIEAELIFETDTVSANEAIIIDGIDLERGVNIGIMTSEELYTLGEEVTEHINNSLLNNQLFKIMGITSLEGLF